MYTHRQECMKPSDEAQPSRQSVVGESECAALLPQRGQAHTQAGFACPTPTPAWVLYMRRGLTAVTPFYKLQCK